MPEHHVARIERLLSEGHSQRAIQRETGVSRSTISRIASGAWRTAHQQRIRARERRTNQQRLFQFDPQASICPECRCAVLLPLAGPPCLACRIRAQGGSTCHGQDEALGLALHPEDRERYYEVRHARLASDEPDDASDDTEREPTDAELASIEAHGPGGGGVGGA